MIVEGVAASASRSRRVRPSHIRGERPLGIEAGAELFNPADARGDGLRSLVSVHGESLSD
jgi:hypothetical protein